MVKLVRHLSNYFDCTFNVKKCCKVKKCQFIGSVNKLKSNFQHLQRKFLSHFFAPIMDNLFGNINQRVSRNVPRLGIFMYVEC